MKEQTPTSAKRKPYDSDIADAQWSILNPMLPSPKRRGRPRKTDLREVVNALACALRMLLAHASSPPPAMADRFRTWKSDGTLKRIHDALLAEVRRADGRNPEPGAAAIDSRSVKTAESGETAGMTRAKM